MHECIIEPRPGRVAAQEGAGDSWLRSGGRASLAIALPTTTPELLRLARSMATRPDCAEDLVQTTYLAAIECAERFRHGERVMPWLAGILANQARCQHRRARIERRTLALSSAGVEAPPDTAAQRETIELVQQGIRSLGQPYRAVLEHCLLDQCSTDEAARSLGRSPGTVRTQLVRGLARLRRVLPRGIA